MEDEINITPPVQPESTPIQPKPKTQLIVLLVILGIAIAGYFVSAKILSVWPFETAAPVSIPTFTPRPSPADELAGLPRDEVLRGWQTYRNEKYGFEVKYPPNLKLSPVFFASSGEEGVNMGVLIVVAKYSKILLMI